MTDDEHDELHHKAAFYAAQGASEMIEHMEDEELSKATSNLMEAVGEMVMVMRERKIPRMMISAALGSAVTGTVVEMLRDYGEEIPFADIPDMPE